MRSEADRKRTERRGRSLDRQSQPLTSSAQGESRRAFARKPWLCLGCSGQHGMGSLLLEPSLAPAPPLWQSRRWCIIQDGREGSVPSGMLCAQPRTTFYHSITLGTSPSPSFPALQVKSSEVWVLLVVRRHVYGRARESVSKSQGIPGQGCL